MPEPWLDALIDETLHAEGWPRYTDRPNDRGGPTKGGITLATLQRWHRLERLPHATVADLKALSEATARAIYAHLYVYEPHFDAIVDELLRWQVVDAGVLSGTETATQWLQAVAGVKVDGILGPITAARVNSLFPHAVGVQFAAVRCRFLGRLVTRKRTQAEWAHGWLNRATKFLDLEAERFLGHVA